MLLISPKKLFFFSQDIQIFVFVFPFFSLSAIALEDDQRQILKFITNCLNNKSITQFVCYFEKEKGMKSKLCQLVK